MDLRNIVIHPGNDGVSIQRKLGLGVNGERLSNSRATMTERTLKTRRILLRSDFQPAIISLSLFAWKSRETAFCLPFLMSFLWIPANMLQSRASSVGGSEPASASSTHVVSCLMASFTGSLRSFNNFPFNPRLRAVQTSAHASPSSKQSASFVVDSCTLSISVKSNQHNAGRNVL